MEESEKPTEEAADYKPVALKVKATGKKADKIMIFNKKENDNV